MREFEEAFIDAVEEIMYWLRIPFVLVFFIVLTCLLPFIMKRPEEQETYE